MNTDSKKILIVEDSPTQAIMLESVLEDNGFKVKVARSGEIALDMIGDFQPKIIISDVVMPGISGYDLCRRIKEDEATKDVPVILLTSLSDPYDVIKGLQCGADNFITKPYREDFLLSRIQYILINQELRANALQGDSGIQFYFAGEKLSITSNRIQIVDLLFSSFENAIQKNDELKAVNKELESTQEKLQEAIKEATKANQAKGEFLAAMSHDIRTPMNGIVGMVQLLKETELNNEQADYLDTVQQSSDSLLNLINDILDFSKIDAGRMDLSPETFDLWNYVENNLKVFSLRAEDVGVELVCEIDWKVPRSIHTDSHRLGQILTNLVGNSLKFTASGQIKVKVSELDRVDGVSKILFSVEDTGCGISEEELKGIFDPFSQVKDSGQLFRKGTGLGLTICSRLSQLLGGDICVESELGVGSRFYFTIKAAVTEEDRLPRERFKDENILTFSPSNETLASMLNSLSSVVGSITTTEGVQESIEALAEAERVGKPFGVVIVDTFLQEETAFNLMGTIKEAHPGVKILPILGAIDFKETKTQCGKMGLPVTMTRPFHGGTVLERILSLFDEDLRSPEKIEEPGDVILFRKLKILVAEDNKVNQRVIQQVMKRLNHDCVIVENGREAISALEKDDFDVVLMDIMMPELGGIEATREIRASTTVKDPAINIIALTANAMKGDREKCLDEGMDDYLSKPIRLDDLDRLLKKIMS